MIKFRSRGIHLSIRLSVRLIIRYVQYNNVRVGTSEQNTKRDIISYTNKGRKLCGGGGGVVLISNNGRGSRRDTRRGRSRAGRLDAAGDTGASSCGNDTLRELRNTWMGLLLLGLLLGFSARALNACSGVVVRERAG